MYQHQASSSGPQDISTRRPVQDGAWRLSSGRCSRWVCRSGVAPLWLLLMTLLLPGAWSYLNEEQEELLVELHNHYRGLVSPSASAMLPLRWDSSLKLLAESYAAKCVWNHNPELEDTGENLFASNGPLDLREALEKWFLEHLDYDFNNNSCDEDKMCGHYTQMVWADTHRVGCAFHICSTLEGLDWERASFLVCNYYPAGNYEGERPYVEGDWCSRCPENMQKCENNLCVAEEVEMDEDEDEDDGDATWGTIVPPPETSYNPLYLEEQIQDMEKETFVPPPVTVETHPDTTTSTTTSNNNPVGNLLDTLPTGTPEPGTPSPPSQSSTVHITTEKKPFQETVDETKENKKREEDERKETERELIIEVNLKRKETASAASAVAPVFMPLVSLTVMLAHYP